MATDLRRRRMACGIVLSIVAVLFEGCRGSLVEPRERSQRLLRSASPRQAQHATDRADASLPPAADASMALTGEERAPSFLERICRSGAVDSRAIDQSLLRGGVLRSERYSFHEQRLSVRPDAEPEIVFDAIGTRHASHSINAYYRNRADDPYWAHVAIAPDPPFRYWRFGPFLGEAAVLYFDTYHPAEQLGIWSSWRRIAIVPERSDRVRIFVQCGDEVRSQLYFISHHPAHWCLLPALFLPDAVRAAIPCIQWMAAHPPSE